MRECAGSEWAIPDRNEQQSDIRRHCRSSRRACRTEFLPGWNRLQPATFNLIPPVLIVTWQSTLSLTVTPMFGCSTARPPQHVHVSHSTARVSQRNALGWRRDRRVVCSARPDSPFDSLDRAIQVRYCFTAPCRGVESSIGESPSGAGAAADRRHQQHSHFAGDQPRYCAR